MGTVVMSVSNCLVRMFLCFVRFLGEQTITIWGLEQRYWFCSTYGGELRMTKSNVQSKLASSLHQ